MTASATISPRVEFEVSLHRRLIDDQAGKHELRLRQRSGREKTDLGQCQPFAVPRARWRARDPAPWLSSISEAASREIFALASRTSDEIGLRFCGMVEDAPRCEENGSNTSPISVAIRIMTS